MRALQHILLVLIFLLLMAAGLDGLLANLPVFQLGDHPLMARFTGPFPWPWTVSFGPMRGRLIGLALFALPLAYLAATFAIWRRRPAAFRVETSDNQVLLLEPGALIKFARLQVANHPAVVAQRVRVRQSGNHSLAIVARVRIRPIQSVPAIQAGIERSIRDGFAQVLGIEKIDEVRVIIGLDDKSLTQRPGVETPAEPKPEPPVRAPLDEDEDEIPYGNAGGESREPFLLDEVSNKPEGPSDPAVKTEDRML